MDERENEGSCCCCCSNFILSGIFLSQILVGIIGAFKLPTAHPTLEEKYSEKYIERAKIYLLILISVIFIYGTYTASSLFI